MGMIRQEKWIRMQGILLAVLLFLMTAVPAGAAQYSYPYPTAENKKGLALGADMEEDALELNVCHATINFELSTCIARKSEHNPRSSYSYKYKGKKYWFRRANIDAWERILKKLKKNNMIVTGILLLEKRSDLKNLIYPPARGKKAAYYAWNMDGGKNQRQIEAAVSFLAKRYSGGKHGRVVGWIVGNEIDSASEWNAAGNIGFSEYMDLYARMFETCSRIIRNVYSNARLYVPLDHFWNTIFSNQFKSRDCLDAFAARMAQDGYPWNLAYHAYNGDLMQPSITDAQYLGTTNELSTPIITMKNLSVLTNYVRDRWGTQTRIILSENGYSSTWQWKNVSAQQSEAVALSYYLAMADPMVDSFIYYSQVDQNALTKEGASFGLWTVSKKERATEKKPSWSVYKYMDTDQKNPVLEKARVVSEGMTGSKAALTRTILEGTWSFSGKYGLRKKLKKGWKGCGAVRSVRRSGDSYKLTRDPSRNENVYWGLQKQLRGLDASACHALCLTVNGARLTGGKTELLVRMFSGNRNLFETSAQIRAKKRQRIRIDMSGWMYRNHITGIQILVKRVSGNWKKGAGISLEKIGFN